MDRRLAEAAREAGRELRKNMTSSERLLWAELRDRKLLGKRFLRQHPIFIRDDGKESFFVADFYCHENRLVIEVDGKVHHHQQEYDRLRTMVMNEKGIRVVRFRNEEIENHMAHVLERVKENLNGTSALRSETRRIARSTHRS